MNLPFLLVRDGHTVVPVLAGLDAERGLVGFDLVRDRLLEFGPEDVTGAVSTDPSAVFWGLELDWAQERERRQAAESTHASASGLAKAPCGCGCDGKPVSAEPAGRALPKKIPTKIVWRREGEGIYRALLDGHESDYTAERNDNEGPHSEIQWMLFYRQEEPPVGEDWSRKALTARLLRNLKSRMKAGAREAREAGMRLELQPVKSSRPPRTPSSRSIPHSMTLRQLAVVFLANVELADGDPSRREHDPRATTIAAALKTVGLSNTDVTEVLGAGSFGTASRLRDGRVLKLTTDPTEVQAGHVLRGQTLAHVVRVHEAWFIRGVQAKATIDQRGRKRTKHEFPVGALITEAVLPLSEDSQTYWGLSEIIHHFKERYHVYPHELVKLTATQARESLREASRALEADLRDSGKRRGYGLDEAVADAAADALRELREHQVYAIDAHGGNIGKDEASGVWKLFDVGTSSSPRDEIAPEIGKGQAKLPLPGVTEAAREDRRTGALRGWEHRRERDERVVQNLDPETLALWERVGPSLRGTPEERLRAFQAYVHDHPDEVIEAQQLDADAQLEILIAQRQGAVAGGMLAEEPSVPWIGGNGDHLGASEAPSEHHIGTFSSVGGRTAVMMDQVMEWAEGGHNVLVLVADTMQRQDFVYLLHDRLSKEARARVRILDVTRWHLRTRLNLEAMGYAGGEKRLEPWTFDRFVIDHAAVERYPKQAHDWYVYLIDRGAKTIKGTELTYHGQVNEGGSAAGSSLHQDSGGAEVGDGATGRVLGSLTGRTPVMIDQVLEWAEDGHSVVVVVADTMQRQDFVYVLHDRLSKEARSRILVVDIHMGVAADYALSQRWQTWKFNKFVIDHAVFDRYPNQARAWYDYLIDRGATTIKGSEGAREPGAAEAPLPTQFVPQGYKFAPIPGPTVTGGAPIVTGFPEVRGQLLRHRAEVPSVETIQISVVFAGSTVHTNFRTAEKAFGCIARLYERAGRHLPPLQEVYACLLPLGLIESRKKLYESAAAWAPHVHAAMKSGLQDRALRRHLYFQTKLPASIALAKLSFTLALLGQDVVCLDARILGRMYGHEEGEHLAGSFGRPPSESVIARYEAVEDAFLDGNPFYRASDPIGRARAQWMSWESAGRPARPETHAVWMNVVR